jgi:glutaredoxin 3
MKALIYSKATCPFCRRAKALLDEQGVGYEEIDINVLPEKRAEMINKSNGRTTVPQIFFNNQHIGGFDDLCAYYKGKKND